MEGRPAGVALLYKHFLNMFHASLFDSVLLAGAFRDTPEATCVAGTPFHDAHDMEEEKEDPCLSVEPPLTLVVW